jgi:RNA polymerase sigma-70 factor (ECF subfamily)
MPNMEEFLVRDARLAEVRAAIQELPANYRAAVLMHKYQELDYGEMARVLNCSVPAIKSLLFRAYENLRKRLAHLDPLAQPRGARRAAATMLPPVNRDTCVSVTRL